MFCKVIEERRKRRGIPIAELARRVGMNNVVLWRCLKGEREFRDSEFIAVCRELEMSLDELAEEAQGEAVA